MKKIEYLLSLAALTWGLAILNPWSDAFTTSITFSVMAQVGGEIAWGLALTLVGLFGILVNKHGALKKRRTTLALNIVSWFLIAVFYFAGNPYGTGFIPYVYLGLIGIVVYVDARK